MFSQVLEGFLYIRIPVLDILVPKTIFSLFVKFNWSLICALIYSKYIMHSTSTTFKYIYLILSAEVILFESYGLKDVFLAHLPLLGAFPLTKIFKSRPWMPWLVSALSLVYVLYFHARRALDDAVFADAYGLHLDWFLILTVITNSTFAWDVYDAQTATEDDISMLQPAEKERILLLKTDATLLEFLAYSIMPPGLYTGPIVTFEDFRRFVSFREVLSQPGRKQRIFRCFVEGWGIMIARGFLMSYLNVETIDTVGFQEKSLMFQCLYVYLFCLLSRFKRHASWRLSEAAYIAMGMGLKKNSGGNFSWDGCEPTNMYLIERTTSMAEMVQQWNQPVNKWLHRYLYRRLQKALGKTRSSTTCNVVTFFLSALWHGLLPGYFCFFLTMSFLSAIFKGTHYLIVLFLDILACKREVDYLRKSSLGFVIMWIFCAYEICFAMVPFDLLSYGPVSRFWARQHYFGLVLPLLFYFGCSLWRSVAPKHHRS